MKRFLSILWLFLCVPLHAEDIHVAAASDLNFAIKEIIAGFEHHSGQKVQLTLGSSGNFYSQIINGAPFDVFLSADLNYPKKLEDANDAVRGSTFVYGVGRIVLWVPNRSGLAPEKTGMQILAGPAVKKIAIANPEHAPYGQAAVAAMQHAKVYEAVKKKLVLGENISQAAQFVQSGAADIGIVALSLALSPPMSQSGKYWTVPESTYPRLEQGAVLLKHGGDSAKAFHVWLRSPESKMIFAKYGFVSKP